MLFRSPVAVVAFAGLVSARDIIFPPLSGYSRPDAAIGQVPISDLHPWGPNDEVPGAPSGRFAGLQTFANLPYVYCLKGMSEEHVEPLGDDEKFDIAFLGAPFDTGTTARPGARFGPSGIRQGSRRIGPAFAWNIYTDPKFCIQDVHSDYSGPSGPQSVAGWPRARVCMRAAVGTKALSLARCDVVVHRARAWAGENSFQQWAKIVDCGDAPLTFLDNTIALKQLDRSHHVISRRQANSTEYTTPRIITLGGDHTTTLSALRSTYAHWGQVSVLHFDSHLDTWDPNVLGGGVSHYAGVNHGTFLHIAHEEGLIQNTSMHAGIRGPVSRPKGDIRNDLRCGFEIIKAREIDSLGTAGVIEKLKKRVEGSRVYISVDIDVLDPAFAPGTGTAEVGGWTTRELLTILDGLEGIEIVGADVVEVAPAYDNPGETTVLAAGEVAHSLMTLMVKKPVKSLH